jgi:hypothetical protein
VVVSRSIRPYVTTGIAFAAASVIAVTPITAPAADVHVGAVRAPAVELAAAPALGAIPIQIATNQFYNVVDDVLILSGVGGFFSGLTPPYRFCVPCGPAPWPQAVTGFEPVYGALGAVITLTTSPSFFTSLTASGVSLPEAAGWTLLYLVSPLPYTLIVAGPALASQAAKAVNALMVTARSVIDIAATALIQAPLTLVQGVVGGVQATAAALAAGADLGTAGAAVLSGSIFAPAGSPGLPAGGAVTQVANAIEISRTNVYDAVAAPTSAFSNTAFSDTALGAAPVDEPMSLRIAEAEATSVVEPPVDKKGPERKVVESLKAIPGKAGYDTPDKGESVVSTPDQDPSVSSAPDGDGTVSGEVDNPGDDVQKPTGNATESGVADSTDSGTAEGS